MKKLMQFLLGVALLAAASAWAAPLATYQHNYGSRSGQVNPGGTDSLSNGYVTVSDSSSSEFNDAFNFASLAVGVIDHFDLTINYARTDGAERWSLQPGNTAGKYLLDSVGSTPTSTKFTINSGLGDQFKKMVADKKFFFLFDENTFDLSEIFVDDNFRLYSATLDVYGQGPAGQASAVPEPASLALLGLGLTGMGVIRRRKPRTSL
jgi:hypothetical protein